MKYLFIFLNLFTNTKTILNNISIDLSANLIQYKYIELYTGIHYTILEEIQGIIELLIPIKFIAIGTNIQTNLKELNINIIFLLKIFKKLYIQILMNPLKKNISFGPTYNNTKQKIAIYYTIQINNSNDLIYNNNENRDISDSDNDNDIINDNNCNGNDIVNDNICQISNNANIINEITNNIITLIPEHKTKIRFVNSIKNSLLTLHLELQEENIDNTNKTDKLKNLYNVITSLYDIILNAILWNKDLIPYAKNNKNFEQSLELNDQEKNLYNLLQQYLNNIKITYNINIETHPNYVLNKLFINTTNTIQTDNQKNDKQNTKNRDIIIIKITKNSQSNKSVYQIKQQDIQIILKEITIDIEKMWDIINPCSFWAKGLFFKSETFSPLNALNKTIRYDLSEIFNNNIVNNKIPEIQNKFITIHENLEKLIEPTKKQKHIKNIMKMPKEKSDKNKLQELITNILTKIENLMQITNN